MVTCPDCEREVCEDMTGSSTCEPMCHRAHHGRCLMPRDWRSEALALRERVASLETAVACERGLKERAQAERDAALAVVSEAVALCRSGYDGPMMGPAIAALMEAVARWESLR